MSNQIEYYDHFGEAYKNDILNSEQPHLWTRDYKENGKVHQEMKRRVGLQQKFVDKHFNKKYTVFDIGCGFGRQAYLLATMGFYILGIDSSPAFIEIAEELFATHNYNGAFLCADFMKTELRNHFKNVLVLDVLEHVIPYKRRRFMQKIFRMTESGSRILMTLPHEPLPVKKTIKKAIKQYFNYFTRREEHPYFIPQKQDVEKLTMGYFTIIDFEETPETDYYVLQRI